MGIKILFCTKIVNILEISLQLTSLGFAQLRPAKQNIFCILKRQIEEQCLRLANTVIT